MATYEFKCTCCKQDGPCLRLRVKQFREFNFREPGDHPDNCIQPEHTKTACEENNVDIKVTDYAEYLGKQTALYLLGVKNGGIEYDTFTRRTWNYGKLRPVR